jgi:hypothetical protein
MLIRRLDTATLDQAEKLAREVAGRLAHARSAPFGDEAQAEAYLWEIIALMQRQAGITALILTAAIDERNAQAADETEECR